MRHFLAALAFLANPYPASADNPQIIDAIDPADTVFVPGAFDAPDQVALSEISENSMRATWRDLSTAEQGFIAFYRPINDDAHIAWHRGGSTEGSAPGKTGENFSTVIDSLRSGRGYCVTIAALHSGRLRFDGDNEACTRTLGDPIDFPRPDPPDIVHTISGERFVEMTWRDESASETEFRLERRGTGLTWQTLSTIIAVSQTIPNDAGRLYRFNDRTAFNDRENCYRVAASNADFETMSSVTCVFTFPIRDSDFAVTERRSDGFSLTWTDNAENEDGYFVKHCREIDGEQDSESCANSAPVGPFTGQGSIDLDGLQPSTDYNLSLHAFNPATPEWGRGFLQVRTRAGQPSIDGVELFYNSSLNLVPFNPSSGQTMTLDWFACNAGDQTPSQNWVTSVEVFRSGVLIDQDEVNGASLATGTCLQQAVTIGPLQPGDYSLTTVLDGEMSIVEVDEGNNTLTYGLIIND